MKRTATLCFSMALAFALVQPTLAQDAPASRVQVDLGEFSQMRETKHLHGGQLRDTTRSIQTLADWLQAQAERSLPADQALLVTLRDVDLAGEYEPGRTDMYDIRVIKSIYPPRIELDYRLSDAAGSVLREGEVTLRDTGFLHSATFSNNDALRFEKRMLRDWLRSLTNAQDG